MVPISQLALKEPENGNMIHLSVDADDAFDYENSEKAKYTVQDLKNILAREIKDIQNEVAGNSNRKPDKLLMFTSFDSAQQMGK